MSVACRFARAISRGSPAWIRTTAAWISLWLSNAETFTLEQKQGRGGGLDVFLARLLGSEPDRGALCIAAVPGVVRAVAARVKLKVPGADFFLPVGVIQHGVDDLIFREVEDRDLIKKARRGSVDAYNLLVSHWEKRIYNYVLRLVGHREDALDATQDTFLKAYQSLGKLEDEGRFAPWLFRIAHNEAYTLLRKRRPEGEMPADIAEGPERPRLYPVELRLAVEGALARLSEEQREAVVLKIYQGFKFEEMAQVLGCPVSTVKSRLYTALELLKTWLAPVDARGVE